MKLREEFVLRALETDANMSELCREFGISRKTGHKWVKRYRQGGVDALQDMSRRPRCSPLRLSGEMTLRILELKASYPRWGPKKLQRLVQRRCESTDVIPSVRTVARVLERAGQVTRRRRRSKSCQSADRFPVEVSCPNALWTADFKGWWRTGDGQRCEPLTVRDDFSRYVLQVKILMNTRWQTVREQFERLFETYGMPEAIRVDNGAPFGSTRARAGLTRLSAWWVSLGIRVVFGRPSHPEDNGAHERMHADIRSDLELDPKQSVLSQQQACDQWRHEFNHVRPHEALKQQTPAQVYQPSARRYRGPRVARYSPLCDVRVVSSSGHINFRGKSLFISRAMARYSVGLQSVDDERLRVWFYDVDLGELRTTAAISA